MEVHQNGFKTLTQHKGVMRPKLEKVVVGTDKRGEFIYKCMLGEGDAAEVCRSAWAKVLYRSRFYFNYA